jgi:hypothetical protein
LTSLILLVSSMQAAIPIVNRILPERYPRPSSDDAAVTDIACTTRP